MSPTALRRQIGQLFILGFDGQQLPVELRAIAREFGLGGVVLFGRNIADPEQVSGLCYEAASMVPGDPPWVSVDQEGGRVARLKAPFTAWPPMVTLGRSGDDRLAERFARALARELRTIGITLDFAPVLDVHTNAKNSVIGDRALGDKAEDVARLGSSIITALQDEGVAACGKHFPGHGDTVADSHHELPLVEHPPERLREVEFVPFRAAVDAGVAMIMTAHVLVPAFDEARPASLSRRIVTGVLRDELGYEGVIVTDDLDMKAIAADYAAPKAAVLALEAGSDAVLVCGTSQDAQAAAIEAVIHAIEQEQLPVSGIEGAMKRHRRAKERFLAAGVLSRPASRRTLMQLLNLDEHRAIADEMARFA